MGSVGVGGVDAERLVVGLGDLEVGFEGSWEVESGSCGVKWGRIEGSGVSSSRAICIVID